MSPRFAGIASLPLILSFLLVTGSAQTKVPPYDLWDDQVIRDIKNRSTLEISIVPHLLYSDVFFTSNPSASWFDAKVPYAEHTGEKIRIHGFLASPLGIGPFPALVLGHGHRGHADRDLALGIAALGFVALSIDGPSAGQSTGGPADDDQAWISVDKGPQYGYLFHYAYAGMRALTLLEALAALPANPYGIDAGKLGVMGASMGGMFTTYINGIDDRVKAAVILASAGNLQHTLRYPNSWLYHGIYTGTRDLPYNGNDPLNSIENVDSDSTMVTFLNYFDPIRYAPRQHAPVLTIIGTHDEYFPLPCANLMQLAISSAGTSGSFQKRLWLLPNAPHRFDTASDILEVAAAIHEWLDYSFGMRDTPLATPQVTRTGLSFEVTLPEASSRLDGAQVTLYAALRVDSTTTPIRDFQSYAATRQSDLFVARIPDADQLDPAKLIYFATIADAHGLLVSSLVYKSAQTERDRPIDLSTDFVPALEQFPGDNISVPMPPPGSDSMSNVASSEPAGNGSAYQGLALTNQGAAPITVRVEARSPEGRLAAAEGLINPAFIFLPPNSQRVFLAEEWLGPGAINFAGSLHFGWNDSRGTALGFRGSNGPPALEGIGPASWSAATLWIPLVPEEGNGVTRRLRIFAGPDAAADVQVFFRNRFGSNTPLRTKQVQVRIEAAGSADIDIAPPSGLDALDSASAEIHSSAPIASRLEISTGGDTRTIEARPAPADTKIIAPHVEWNTPFKYRLLLLNTSGSTQDARMRLRTSAGADAASGTVLAVQPYMFVSMELESLTGISASTPAASGSLEIQNPGGGLLVALVIDDPRSGAASSSPLLAARSGSWNLPFIVESSGYWTGLGLTNGSDTPAGLNLVAYDASGAVIGRASAVLNANESRTALLSQWMPELNWNDSGYLVITATGTVAGISYFGTTDGAAFAAMPLTPVAP